MAAIFPGLGLANGRDQARSGERQKDRFHGPEREDQVGLPSTEVRRREEDISGGPDVNVFCCHEVPSHSQT